MSKLPRDSPIKRGDQAEVARHLATQGLASRPGTKYAYTFRGYAAVSRVIEVATGRPIAEVMQEKLLAPLGMKETTFTPGVSLVRRHPRFAAQAEGRSDDDVVTQIESLRLKEDPSSTQREPWFLVRTIFNVSYSFTPTRGVSASGKLRLRPYWPNSTENNLQPRTMAWASIFAGAASLDTGEQPEHSLASTSRPAVFLSSLPKRAFQTLVRSRRALPKSFSLKN